jgi:hypothetical protein
VTDEPQNQEEPKAPQGPSAETAEDAPTEPGQSAEGEEGTTVPNEVQQPTPAGNEFSQEGGPTVDDQAINAANNELKKQQEAQEEE